MARIARRKLQRLLEASFCRLQRKLDVQIGVRGRDEGSFELRRGQEYSGVQHIPEVLGIALAIGLFCGGVVVNGLAGKEQSSQRSDRVDLSRDLLRAQDFPKAGCELPGEFFDAIVKAGLAELIE